MTFGTIWCPDCRAASPLLEELHQDYPGLFIDAEGVIRARIVEKVTPEILDEKLPLIGVDL